MASHSYHSIGTCHFLNHLAIVLVCTSDDLCLQSHSESFKSIEATTCMLLFQSEPLSRVKKTRAVTSDYLRKWVGHSQFLTLKKCRAFGIERFCFPLPMHGMLEFHCAKKKVIDLFF